MKTENNGIGVTKINEGARSIGLELTQFVHKDFRLIEQIIEKHQAMQVLQKT